MIHRRAVPLIVLLICLPLGGGHCWAQPDDPPESLEVPDEIVVATRDVPPFAMQNGDGDWEGISIDLMRQIKSDLEEASKHKIQLRFESYPLDEMLDAVAAGRVDVAVAAITVNAERERRMDFTHAFFQSGLGIAVGSSQRRAAWQGIIEAVLSPTFLRILAGLMFAMLISAIAVYFFERKHHDGDFEYGIVRGIGAGLWWAAVTLTTVGYGDKVPKTLPGRMIGLIWMFSGLFIIASFTAAVTSALTVNQLRSRVAGPGDLSRVKVATVAGSTSAGYLRSRHIRFRSHESVELALQSLAEGRCDAVVYDAPILRHLVFQAEAGDQFVLPVTFERQSYAFALPSGSPLREPINQSLLHWTSSSSWEDTLQSYLGDDVE
ncbi:ABC transporter glutamine-binding protein GlnH precursor [Stieleria neptunia]|uniref:ABC transporter glutamine-binding protein GlnH n=1 Tax=Stieleria neptunia TaxID=2527979 RepID=A0A518I1W9_9BACT|nr:transporter substrate-binding domain-containing protein [Stieleria neptunia]QDV47081.1 ABC transporter glutamine-binding protein GlnH precursor [Stieleria neptunia]